MRRLLLPLLLGSLCAGAARAEVVEQTEQGFRLRFEHRIAASPEQVYAALTQVGRWWSAGHTYSGEASNLTLEARAGGCFCERWAGGSVRHGEVVMALPGRMLRLNAPLGPLQDEGVAAALFFNLAPDPGGTRLEVFYNVGGARPRAATSAPVIDRVLGEQTARLARYAATGRPAP